jgi:predicted ABC-type ATPase
VLSTDKYRRLVSKAKQLGYAVWLIYVVLDSPERCIERIKLRVLKGGHHVEDDDVRTRYKRSLEQQFPWFLDEADRAWIYDNSGAAPKRIGEKREGVITLDESALEIVKKVVEPLQSD